MTDQATEAKQAARAVWSAGDFDTVYRLTVAPVGERIVRHVGVQAGERVLDVACGSGNAALPAAQAGASVVGLDLVPKLLEAGRRHAAERGVDIEWIEGDAEELPFEDDSFDVAVSTFGVMFAPRHAVAAGEIARVLKPGGRIGLCNWTTDGSIGEFFTTVSAHVGAPPPPEPPTMWGNEDHVRGLFGPLGVEVELRRETVDMTFPTPDEALELMSTKFGPLVMAKAALESQGRWEALRDDLLEMYRRHTGDDGVLFPAEYLVTLGRKG